MPDQSNYRIWHTYPIRFIYNNTGYINEECFNNIANEFMQIWRNTYPGLRAIVIGDNLDAHRSVKVIQQGLNHDIHWWFLVRNTTHWSQPLDNLVFASFKKMTYQMLDRGLYAKAITGNVLDVDFVTLVLDAWNKSITPPVIRRAFTNTGLAPFNKKKILELLNTNHIDAVAPIKSVKENTTKSTNDVKESCIKGVITVWNKYVANYKAEKRPLAKPKANVKKNVPYDPLNILLYDQNRKADECRLEKERQEARNRKKEESQQRIKEKEIAKAMRDEELANRRREKAAKLAEKEKRRKENTCAANCGRTCRVGSGWVGCSNCDFFWICPSCYGESKIKRKLTLHEKKCN